MGFGFGLNLITKWTKFGTLTLLSLFSLLIHEYGVRSYLISHSNG